MKPDRAEFFDQVYSVVRQIPRGRVCSYGIIARLLGGSPRLVGYALNHSHVYGDVPAHRVVNRNGLLTGKHHFETPDRMRELLEAEGVEVVEDRVVRFETLCWDPLYEIDPEPNSAR